MKTIKCIQIWIMERKLKSIKYKMRPLWDESIRIGYENIQLTARGTFAVINGQPLDNTKYDENCRRNSEIHKKLSQYMKEELELTYRYFDLIGKPIRPSEPLKLVAD